MSISTVDTTVLLILQCTLNKLGQPHPKGPRSFDLGRDCGAMFFNLRCAPMGHSVPVQMYGNQEEPVNVI